MAGNVSKARFVRCPKCHNVLMEVADVPVYQCGGCGTVLRAKNRSTNGGDVSSVSSEAAKKPQDVSGHESSDDRSTLVEENMFPCSSDEHSSAMDSKEEQTIPSNQHPSSLDIEDDHNRKGKSLVGEDGDMNSTAEDQLDEITEIKIDYPLNEGSTGDKMEEPAETISQIGVTMEEDIIDGNLCDKCRDTCGSPTIIETGADYPVNEEGKKPHTISVSYEVEEPADTISKNIALEEDIVDESLCDMSRDTFPTSRSSQIHDGSASSSDDGYNDHLRLSDRSFRHHQEVLDSADTERHKERGDKLRNKGFHDHAEGQQPEERNIRMKSLNPRYGSAAMGSFNPNGSRFPSRYGSSLDSEELYSVQNWTESDRDRHSRYPSRGSAFHGNSLNHPDRSLSTKFRTSGNDGQELLRKLDELREQVGGLYDQRVEGKWISRPGVASQLHSIMESIDPELLQHRDEAYYAPRKVVPQQYQLSQMPLMEHPQCSWLPAYVCSQNEPFRHPTSCLYRPHEFQKVSVKEKRPQRAKRHCRPISSGAPFVICHKCLQLLQLPVDFLMSRSRVHRVRCGACSEVLAFSSQGDDLRIPRTPNEAVHRRNMFGDYYQGDSASYAEDFEPSYCRSYDTDTTKQVLHHSRNSSQDKNGELVTGQRLHWLMGYNSARELLYQPIDSDEEHTRTKLSMRHSRRPSEESSASLGSRGRGKGTSLHQSSAGGTSPNVAYGVGKKGVRKLNQALLSLRLKAHQS